MTGQISRISDGCHGQGGGTSPNEKHAIGGVISGLFSLWLWLTLAGFGSICASTVPLSWSWSDTGWTAQIPPITASRLVTGFLDNLYSLLLLFGMYNNYAALCSGSSHRRRAWHLLVAGSRSSSSSEPTTEHGFLSFTPSWETTVKCPRFWPRGWHEPPLTIDFVLRARRFNDRGIRTHRCGTAFVIDAVGMSKVEVDLYEVLEISQSATKEEIRKAYRKAALASHPDKVPEAERETAEIRFKAVQEAYDILYDEDKRHLYDTHGMGAFNGSGEPGMNGGPDLDDILAQMFGMGGMGGGMPGGPRPQKPRKSRNEEQKYEVNLEELYKGKTVKFASTKNVICGTCQGKGGKERATAKKCATCEGQGFKQVLQRMGQYLTPTTVACSTCNGDGEWFSPKDKCKKCKGNKTTEEKKMLEIYIPRGAREGDKIVLEGEADQVPGQEPGDIIFHLVEEEHATFKRAGADLMAVIDVTLAEALTGFSRVVVKHLDGRGIELQHPKTPGQVLSPGQVLKIRGEGMPIKRSDARGDLYLHVNIKFPDEKWKPSPAVLEKLKEMLPKPDPLIQADTVDEVDYDLNGDLDDFGSQDPQGGSAWEDDDEEGETAQCTTQ